MKILIIQQRYGIGDMVIFLPYIHAISKKYNTKVSLLVKKSSKASDIFAEDHHIEDIIFIEKEMDGTRGFFKLYKKLKNKNFDKAFIFNSSLRYNLVSRISGIKKIYQYPLFRSKDNLVNSAKIFTEKILGEIVSTEPHLKIKDVENTIDKNFTNICLGISASGITKRWDINNYIKLCEEISKIRKCNFYIAGGEKDKELINKLKKSKVGVNCKSFERMNIKETLPIIKNCDCYIGNDTGFLHLSVSLGVKSLALFMDSPVMAYGKYSSKIKIIEPEGENNSTTHNTLGKDRISFDEVLFKAKELLN